MNKKRNTFKKFIFIFCYVFSHTVHAQFFYQTNTHEFEEIAYMTQETSKGNYIFIGEIENMPTICKINKFGILNSIILSADIKLKYIYKINANRFLILGKKANAGNIELYIAYIDSNLNVINVGYFNADPYAIDFNLKVLIVDDYIYAHLFLFFPSPNPLVNKIIKIDTTLTQVEYFELYHIYLFDFTYFNNRFRFLYSGSLFYQYNVYDGILSFDKNFNLVKLDSALWTWAGDIEIMDHKYVFTGIGPLNRTFITLKDTLNNFKAIDTLYNQSNVESYPCFINSLISYDTIAYATTIYNIDYENNYSTTANFILVNKYDKQLNRIWSKQFGSNKYFLTYSITPNSEKGCIISGAMYDAQQNSQKYDAFILVIDSTGTETISKQSSYQENINIRVFPNPSYNELNINTNCDKFTIELYNQFGLICITHSTSSCLKINTEKFVSGIYFYRITHNGQVISQGKWIKQ